MEHAPPHAALDRINVVGSSGTGKTTFARRLAAQLGSPCIEMDAVFWEPNWTQPNDATFFARLSGALGGERWVLDGNYDRTAPIKWRRAQTIIWLDYSLLRKLFQVTQRTLARIATREALWAGNRESLKMLLSRESIVLFALRTHGTHRERYRAMLERPPQPHITVIRLRSPREAERFLSRLAAEAPP